MAAILYIVLAALVLTLAAQIILRKKLRERFGLPEVESRDFWAVDGAVARGKYLYLGLLLFALKHNIDRLIAWKWAGLKWQPFNYFVLPNFEHILAQKFGLLAVLALAALPFIWAGVALTIRRLRDAGLPRGLLFLFFVPFVNLLFFAVLAAWPAGEEAGPDRPQRLARIIPRSATGAAAMAAALVPAMGALVVVLATHGLQQYGNGLFLGLPFCQGLAAVLIFGYHEKRSLAACVGVALGASAILAGVLFALAIEGLFCIVMAAPLAGALAVAGAVVGFYLQALAPRENGRALLVMLAALPALMGMERAAAPQAPLYAVHTAVDVDADRMTVWDNVVSFSELPPPEEFIFRHGIAYPVRAVIDGQGPGAIRRCQFSTGDFVEPIEVWEPGRLLKFSVTAQPKSMREFTPYPGFEPPHVIGYLVSEGGQFLLTEKGGKTRLEGTTWYRHHLWPAPYWRLWSDAIIHRIHLRVLRHIKAQAEGR